MDSADSESGSARGRHGAITGLGAVTPIGVGIDAFREALRAGRSGVRLHGIEHPMLRGTVAAPCDGFDASSVLERADLERLPRLVPMALAAAREAMAHAGLDASGDDRARRVGLILGTGAGGIDFTLDQAGLAYSDRRPSLWTITNATHGNLAGELSIRLGLRGPSLCVSTGCASSSDACGLALDQLRTGRPGSPDAWVVVGADAHVRWETLSGMELLRVISTRDWCDEPGMAHSASRPFCATRDGYVLGEGAWAAVIERPSFARRREAEPIGELLGYGATCDAYHRVRPDPEMTECVRSIRLALEDAGVGPTEVDLVHYHGTATPLNDASETAAVKEAFGGHAPGLIGTSVKSLIGHPQGASGLASLVATMAGLVVSDRFCPPTMHLVEPDPDCDLDYCANAARALGDAPRVALINCLAFGAKNSALVLRA